MTTADLIALVGADPFDLIDAEAARIDSFYASLAPQDWAAPTRCAGWDRRALLAHLDAVEEYTAAGLTGTVGAFLDRSGGGGLDATNAWGVAQRADLSPQHLLEQWRAHSADNRRELRARGGDATIDTSVGDYPLGRQVYYLAGELAIHGDDAGVPLTAQQRAAQLDWRVRFGVLALAEVDHGVDAARSGDAWLVCGAGAEAVLSTADLVEALSGRLPEGALPPQLRAALVAVA